MLSDTIATFLNKKATKCTPSPDEKALDAVALMAA